MCAMCALYNAQVGPTVMFFHATFQGATAQAAPDFICFSSCHLGQGYVFERGLSVVAKEHRGPAPYLIHHRPNVGQEHSQGAPTWGGYVHNTPRHGVARSTTHPSMGQQRPQRTLAWGKNVNNTPQHGAKMSTACSSVGRKRPHRTQHGADTSTARPAVGQKYPHCTPKWDRHVRIAPQHGAEASTTCPSASMGQTRQQCTLVWGKNVHIAPHCGAQMPIARPNTGQTHPHRT